ncbi:MAG: hypothetical protein OXG68_02330 [Chloroflexi bacterium]|nr:hypothetical protein [Chloroflexota bacterium]
MAETKWTLFVIVPCSEEYCWTENRVAIAEGESVDDLLAILPQLNANEPTNDDFRFVEETGPFSPPSWELTYSQVMQDREEMPEHV